MKYYGVTSKFYDNGKIEASCFEVEANSLPVCEYIETSTCDIYRDYFETKEEAEAYKEESLSA